MYPSRHQLPELTAHLIGLLERRRGGVTEWNADAEKALTEDVNQALAEAGKQFAEIADDKPYWARIEESVREVVLPRYFKLAREEHEAEKNKYGLWRGGDFVSRVAYAAAGLVGAVIIWRSPIPDFFEPLALAFFIGGPMIPDLQLWFAKRRYAAKLKALIDDTRDEAALRAHYRPFLDSVDPQSAGESAVPRREAEKEKS